ncbi:hypothetical protein FRC12_021847 [Ceratobasidium sp. 428]|nr:hypothetical protein FRC12_021847 [Ceratobasidium sp. 428]
MPPVKVRADHGGLQPPSAYSVISQFEPRRLLKYGTAVAPTPDWTSPSSDHASPRHTPKPGEPSELSRGPTITVSSSAPPPALSSPLKQSLPRALYGYLVAVASRFNLPQEPEEPSDAIVDLNMPELDPSTSDSNFPSSLSLGPLRSNTQNSTTQMEMEEETEAAWKASRQPPPAPVPSSSMPPTRDDPSAVYVNSQILDSQDRRTEGTGVDITSVMTFEEIIPHLNRRGCRNLADEMDPTSYSKNPVNGGGLGDIYKGVLKNGVEVAIKTIRPVYSQDEEIQKHLKRAAREIYTWSKCRHQNVQPLLGLLEFRGQIGMVSVWEKHGNIKNYLRLNPVVDSCQLVRSS